MSHLPNKPVEISVGGSLNIQVSSADVVDGLVVDHECTVRVLKGGVGCKDGIVWLYYSRRHLGNRGNVLYIVWLEKCFSGH